MGKGQESKEDLNQWEKTMRKRLSVMIPPRIAEAPDAEGITQQDECPDGFEVYCSTMGNSAQLSLSSYPASGYPGHGG